ncbi:MAG: peptidylprolyl isomerase [Thermoplasmata archaeon]|nr:peptidylprolyl isomerase [Thermoplasmata archaeon]NIS13227.1 peptidylprolyl isomerase [Thermoplasmata archaeon]NIS21119.1 peptidylprolyl isomerase [Thermoplasmata archaeon]NIT78602.1 peptidylprolyl isomerase [Thermoplasmata archaeon]NIU50175.1 peptidylprolyl isomerase [Thermoplasmata archaeon]
MSPRAIIETSMGMITAELYGDQVPGTVDNFVNLANSGFYKNMIFHRIIKGFVIQTGDPTGSGRGGSDRKIKLETRPDLKHIAGALGMARGPDRDSASSQFYICDDDVHGLDGNYAVFGKVVEGMDVVHAIAAVPTGAGDRPVDPPKLLSVTIQ